jgi:hypothetical protein
VMNQTREVEAEDVVMFMKTLQIACRSRRMCSLPTAFSAI